MLRFSQSFVGLTEAIEPYEYLLGFDPVSWLATEGNLAITDGENWALFDKQPDGVYTGHYFFVVRGKAARQLGKEMLAFFFENTDVQALRGMTPLENLGARWMSRQLGFKGYGVIETMRGPCELFILTRREWELNNG